MPVLGLQGEVVHADDGTMSHFSFLKLVFYTKIVSQSSSSNFVLCLIFFLALAIIDRKVGVCIVGEPLVTQLASSVGESILG